MRTHDSVVDVGTTVCTSADIDIYLTTILTEIASEYEYSYSLFHDGSVMTDYTRAVIIAILYYYQLPVII